MFDILKLRKRCLASEEEFKKEGVTVDGKDGFYIFQDNGADILAVAHLDTVQEAKHFYVVNAGGYEVVFNQALDDRLGAYIILDVLPALGVKCDVLLTTNEERCDSTAQYFVPTKQYKWIFSFDRMGTDVVLYQYEGKAIEDILTKMDNVVGMGSYSDICELSVLGCVGINWGCAYWDNHTPQAHVILSDAEYMVNQFLAFYEAHKDTLFAWEDDGYEDYGYSRWGMASRHLSDLEWDDLEASRTAGLSKIEKDIYYSTYRDLRCRGWQDAEASGAALDEVAYTVYRNKMANEEDTIDGEYTEKCWVCGSNECPGMVECISCGSQYHGGSNIDDNGLCNLCSRQLGEGMYQ